MTKCVTTHAIKKRWMILCTASAGQENKSVKIVEVGLWRTLYRCTLQSARNLGYAKLMPWIKYNIDCVAR